MKVKIRGLVFAGFAAAVFAQSALATQTDANTVTSKTYVDSKVDAVSEEENGGVTEYGDTTIDEDSPNDKAASSLNVYKFVTGGAGTGFQRKLTANEKDPSLGVYNADGTSVWRPAAGGTYVTMDASGTGAITFDVSSNKIATIGADNPSTSEVEVSEITASSDKLTTGKAVYEYVTSYAGDTYQPKATADSGAQVGVRTGDSTNGYNSTWYSLAGGYADPNSGLGNARYVSVTRTDATNTVWVDLHNTMLISDSITGAGATAISSQAGEKLATGGSVYNYSVPMNWTERGTAGNFAVANKKLVTDASGNVILAEDTAAGIPSNMPDECDTSTGTAVCALVAYWDANIGTNGGVKYEWTIMAQGS